MNNIPRKISEDTSYTRHSSTKNKPKKGHQMFNPRQTYYII